MNLTPGTGTMDASYLRLRELRRAAWDRIERDNKERGIHQSNNQIEQRAHNIALAELRAEGGQS